MAKGITMNFMQKKLLETIHHGVRSEGVTMEDGVWFCSGPTKLSLMIENDSYGPEVIKSGLRSLERFKLIKKKTVKEPGKYEKYFYTLVENN